MNKLYKEYKDIWLCYNSSGMLKQITGVMQKHLKGHEYCIDDSNNIFVGDFSKERPCLVAHLDSVHEYPPMKIRKNKRKGIIYSDNGIGGDDKCGIVAILEILSRTDNVNAIFTSDEEIGGIGASSMHEDWLTNIAYFIEIDRAGASDVLYKSGSTNICSNEMKDEISDTVKKYGFKSNRGSFTDVNILTPRAMKSSINISCGYHNAHMEDEFVVLSQLQNTIDCVEEIVKTVRKTFDWKPCVKKKKKRGRDKIGYQQTYVSDLDYCDTCGKKKATKSIMVEGMLFYMCKKCRKQHRKNKKITVTEGKWREEEKIEVHANADELWEQCSHCQSWVPLTELEDIVDNLGDTKVCHTCSEYFMSLECY